MLKDIESADQAGHEVPFEDRWGGWFVTGKHGGMRHLGNGLGIKTDDQVTFDRDRYANLEKLDQFFPPEAHLTEGSDILALLLMDHQIGMHDRLIEAHYRVRHAYHEYENKYKDAEIAPPVKEVLETEADRVVKYLLFSDEVPLSGERVQGSPDFERVFLATKKPNAQGKSLKDLNLKDRMFEHRCSYMIYSRSFDGLPRPLKEAVYCKLHAVLTAEQPEAPYEHLSAAERVVILEILRETKEDFAAAIALARS